MNLVKACLLKIFYKTDGEMKTNVACAKMEGIIKGCLFLYVWCRSHTLSELKQFNVEVEGR